MLTGKNKENLKIAFISSRAPSVRRRMGGPRKMLTRLSWLILTLTLLVEPILAEQQRKNNKSRPQRQTASATRQSSKPSLANKTPSNIAARARSSMPRTNVSSSIRRGSATARSNLTRIAKPNTSISQSHRALSRQLIRGRMAGTLNRTPVRQPFHRSTRSFDLRSKQARAERQQQSISNTPSHSSSRMSGNASTSIGQQTNMSLYNRVSSDKTSRISKMIITRRPSIITMEKPSSKSIDSRTITNRTSRIGELIGKQRTSTQIVERSPTTDKTKHISLRNRISSTRKSRTINPSQNHQESLITKQKPSISDMRQKLSINRKSLLNSDRNQLTHRLRGVQSQRHNLPSKQKTSIPITRKLTSNVESKRNNSQSRHSKNSGLFEKIRAIGRKPVVQPGGSRQAENRAKASRPHKRINLKVVDKLRSGSREGRSAQTRQKNTTHGNADPSSPALSGGHGGPSKRHHEHRPVVRNKHRYEHIYWDHHNQLRHRIIWPRYRFAVCYRHGPRFAFRYVYPYYLRRYIFISLGGYWPLDYCYLRYYWYGCHPYRWYGYYPIAREVTGDTYNYYTYNYYYGDDGTVPSVSAQEVDGIKPVDHNTFADVREKLAQQAEQKPALETATDIYFDEAVKAFEAGDYETAVVKFTEAQGLAGDDIVIPFAYSQALFANKQYAEAAEVLRTALENVSPEKEGVFYPRGLYSDDEILLEQIEHLSQKAAAYYFDADLQLLLGYHLLGIGEIDKAFEPLESASQDLENAEAAIKLLDLLAKISPALGGQGSNSADENTVQ